MREFKPGDVVQHFKRETVDLMANPTEYLYEILGTGFHSETGEKLVIYRALYESDSMELGHICCRPYDMFYSEVDREKYPSIKQKFRFESYKK